MKMSFKAQGDRLPHKNPVIQYLQNHAAEIAIAAVLTAVIIGITLLSLDALGANRIPSSTVFANPYYPETTFWRFVMVAAAGLAGFGIGWFFSDAGKEVRFIVVLIALGLWAFAVFFDNGPIGWGLASFAAAGAFLAALGYWTAKAVKAFAAPPTTMGSAQWATSEHLHAENVIGEEGFRFGDFRNGVTSLPLAYKGDRHLLTIAPTRSGKGVNAIIPNLLTYTGSCVVIDPKGENAMITAEHRARMGQDCQRRSKIASLSGVKMHHVIAEGCPQTRIA